VREIPAEPGIGVAHGAAHCTLGGKRGTLSIKNAAAFRTVDDGDLADTQTITGGTGALSTPLVHFASAGTSSQPPVAPQALRASSAFPESLWGSRLRRAGA
jgi:hypothetical protein